jgi:hypothetical protein
MAVGDKEAGVRVCVNSALKARGYNPPYDPNQAMNGRYRYQFETMIAFHRRVKACLATKGYAYGYPESQDYINQTLIMKLGEVYAAIDMRTGTSALLGIALESMSPRRAKVRPPKKGATRKAAARSHKKGRGR